MTAPTPMTRAARSSRARRPFVRPRGASTALCFADLMINLLTFFVLLFAWSKPADSARLAQGLGGFLHHLDSWGLPPDERDRLAREERIRALEGRLRMFLPDAAARERAPVRALPGVEPFAEWGFVPHAATFGRDSAAIENDAALRELGRALAEEPEWRARLEIARPAHLDARSAALADARAAAAKAVLADLGIASGRVFTSFRDAAERAETAHLDVRLLRLVSAR